MFLRSRRRHRSDTNALPFIPRSPFTLFSRRPAEILSNNVSGHLLAKRRALEATQADTANTIGVSAWAYRNWEQGAHLPAIEHWPGIIEFLGYDPHPSPSTLGEYIRAWRRAHGASRSTLASQSKLYEATLAKLEADAYGTLDPRIRERVGALEAKVRQWRHSETPMFNAVNVGACVGRAEISSQAS